ncbi:EamA/RhaT family transporter [Ichthyenterobacterium sp. W332]|uniref:EamA/RhaT family transporter n=1 Tax=Microcosmobacter mediterraneus TaxID=3075607 RepID=A0ABU2YIA2_9FLAO|nr:EamA/RhaT family transporter [Ichthyenterobacterium sp. W332]MDT0557522.1 EamA/RhaT family transporter [Ichthyenterobacterium sp. W332]
MIYLLLSITASTLIFVIFKLLGKFKINTLQAIVVNYITACFVGLIATDVKFSINDVIEAEWFTGAILLGFLFISIFNVMALTAQRNGLSVSSVASKMSVIIPVVFGIYVYNESIGFQKLLGIIIALIAVYLTSVKKETKANLKTNLWLPVILFFGSGIIDTSVKYIETTYVKEGGIPMFTATIFGVGFIIGLVLLAIQKLNGTLRFTPLSIIGGIILGIVNYCSMYYLLLALNYKDLESSTLFTINNVAIVAISTLIGLLVFKEAISKTNWVGICLALVSIILVTLAI